MNAAELRSLTIEKEYCEESKSWINLFPLDQPTLSSSVFPQDAHMSPASALVNFDGSIVSVEKLIFCYRALLATIDTCLAGKYSQFDGHTTANCCHGMALLACQLVSLVSELDLFALRKEGEQQIVFLENGSNHISTVWRCPKALVNLAGIYVLGLIKESDPVKGGRTVTTKLKILAPISTNVCNQIAHGLQKRFANGIAMRYELYLKTLDPEMSLHTVPMTTWGKYVCADYIREDKRGVRYASNLFSVQVSLAYLIKSGAKIAVMNDLMDKLGNLKGRSVFLLEGDGQNTFRLLSRDELYMLKLFHQQEPVIIFGGCVYADELDQEALIVKMSPWLENITGLILAGDVFYPQFFQVIDDPHFNSCPIVPEEAALKSVIDAYLDVKGVSAQDPSLYCSTHTYLGSVGEVLHVLHTQENTLPLSFIPQGKRG